MLTFIADESMADRGGAEEFHVSIYGGLVVDEKTFGEFNQFLFKLKDRYVLPQELELKWRFRSYWDNMKAIGYIDPSFSKEATPDAYQSFQDDHTKIKNEVLDFVASSSCEIVIAIRPNKLLHATEGQIIEYSIGAIARKFEKILGQKSEAGIILADELLKRIDDKAVIDHQYILQLCCRGSGAVTFERVLSIVPTINSHVSPLHQINDVVLGSVQYYILEFVRKLKDPGRNTDTAKAIVGKLIGRFHAAGGGKYILNNGILMYPPKTTRKVTPAGVFLNKLEGQLKNDFGII